MNALSEVRGKGTGKGEQSPGIHYDCENKHPRNKSLIISIWAAMIKDPPKWYIAKKRHCYKGQTVWAGFESAAILATVAASGGEGGLPTHGSRGRAPDCRLREHTRRGTNADGAPHFLGRPEILPYWQE